MGVGMCDEQHRLRVQVAEVPRLLLSMQGYSPPVAFLTGPWKQEGERLARTGLEDKRLLLAVAGATRAALGLP
jgi:hypothetical protein